MKNLSDYRKSYEKSELLESSISHDPIVLFKNWFEEAETSNTQEEVNAMTIATIGADGFPKSRVVLLKQLTAEGFIFFTNYNSDKGRSISNNPQVCLSFFWHGLERQVIIKGMAEKTTESLSDTYFDERPEGSRLSAMVSDQSEVIPSRQFLEEKLQSAIGGNIKRPTHWGGYLVKPVEMEFWQGRANRLHDRIRFSFRNSIWIMERLAP